MAFTSASIGGVVIVSQSRFSSCSKDDALECESCSGSRVLRGVDAGRPYPHGGWPSLLDCRLGFSVMGHKKWGPLDCRFISSLDWRCLITSDQSQILVSYKGPDFQFGPGFVGIQAARFELQVACSEFQAVLVLYLKLLRLLPSSLSPLFLDFLAVVWAALGSGRCRRLVGRSFCPFWALRFWETVRRGRRL